MVALYHFTERGGAELCSASVGRCAMASAVRHYTSLEAAQAQKSFRAPVDCQDTAAPEMPGNFNWQLVKALASVRAGEVSVKKAGKDDEYNLGNRVAVSAPFDELLATGYIELGSRGRLLPTQRGKKQVKDAHILGALHTFAAARGVELTPQQAQEVFSGLRRGELVYGRILSEDVYGTLSTGVKIELARASKNLLRHATATVISAERNDTTPSGVEQYIVLDGHYRAASIIRNSPGFTVACYVDTAGVQETTPMSFYGKTIGEARKAYLGWVLAHPQCYSKAP